MLNKNEINIITLGGQDEFGKSLYVIEIDQKLLVFDPGIKDIESLQLKNEILISDTSYLEKNKSRIQGIFISNAEQSCMGAIVYIANKLGAPIYCTPFCKYAIIAKFKKYNETINVPINTLANDQEVKFESFSLKALYTLNTTLESLVFVIKTSAGNIWYARSFVLGSDIKTTQFVASLIKNSDNQNAIAALIGSRYAKQVGFSYPNYIITPYINNIFLDYPKSRIIISCFDDNLFHANEIIKLATSQNRKIFIYGKTLNDNLREAKRLNNLLEAFHLGNFENMNEAENAIIIVSGDRNRLFQKITRLGLNSDENLKFKDTDIFINNTFADIVNEIKGIKAINELAKANIKIIHLPRKEIRPIAASAADVRLFLSFIQPKYLFPIDGLYQDLHYQVKNGEKVGINKDNIIILDNGEKMSFHGTTLDPKKQAIHTDSVFVNNKTTEDVNIDILEKRVVLGSKGIAFIGFRLDKELNIKSSIDIQMRGVIYLKDGLATTQEIQDLILEIIAEEQKKSLKNFNLDKFKELLETIILKYIRKKYRKTPKIILYIEQITN